MLVCFIIAAAVIAADQLTKFAVVVSIGLQESVDLIPGVFRFTYIRNEGAAFGMLSSHRWIFIVLSIAAIVGIIVFVILKKPKNKLLTTALGLVLGGGIGNMIDRLYLGYVVDFLDFYLIPFWKWIFNVADACACVGAGLLVLYLIIDTVRSEKKEREERAAAAAKETTDGEKEND